MTGASLGYSGYARNTLVDYVGTYGHWWTVNVQSTDFADYLYTATDNRIYPQGAANKYIGRAVR